MGSGQSKGENQQVDRNDNARTPRAQNSRETQDVAPAATTTTSQQPSNIVKLNGGRDTQARPVNSDSTSAKARDTDSGTIQTVKKSNDNNIISDKNDQNFRENDILDSDTDDINGKEKQRSPLKVPAVQATNSANLVEFVESSDDDSDTDSLLGLGITKVNNKDSSWATAKSEKNAKSINLPLPAPANQPDYSVVFEQERALNEYNILHGYTAEMSPPKKSNSKTRANNDTTQQDSYPESYAQRLQRDQYTRHQNMMIREKTIYRNPEEWELEESIVQAFDADRFKAANQGQGGFPPLFYPVQPHQDDLPKTPSKPPHPTRSNPAKDSELKNSHPETGPVTQTYDDKRKKRTQLTPTYDSDDEDMMNEIEQEFDF